ncbi:EsV-1-7, partial [Tribonema minus]
MSCRNRNAHSLNLHICLSLSDSARPAGGTRTQRARAAPLVLLAQVPGTVDTSYRRCEALGCTKWPLYAYEGEKARFCSAHREPGMNDVRSRRCQHAGCLHQPSYGMEGFRAQFCRQGADTPDMVDVVSKRCKQAECRRRPLYGFEGQKAQFCSLHKEEGMVDVMNRRCKVRGCKKRPLVGIRFCAEHSNNADAD